VCEELRKALRAPHPERFFEVLHEAGLLAHHFTELDALTYVPAGPFKYHQEGTAFVHTMMVLQEAVKLGGNELERFAAVVHDLGKGTTPGHMLPAHHDHEGRGVELVVKLGHRLRLPVEFVAAGKLASEEHLRVHRFMQSRAGTKVDLVERAKRNPLGVAGLALVSEADALGRVPSFNGGGPGGLRRAAELVRSVTAGSLGLPNDTCKGEAVGRRLRQVRCELLARELPQPEQVAEVVV
jgi:tRNA nucleotidyltransferase (CCA-adding enzyme)